jgi:penicillin-insensitive murein endopeptidase
LLLASSASAEETETATHSAATTATRAPQLEAFGALAQPDSVSCGSTNRGALSDAAMLPDEGFGYVMAEPWRSRESRYGTRELVSLIQRTSAAVAQEHKGSKLSVADLSKEQGGPIASHRSHQNGRDVDLIYYAMDAEGQPFYPDSHMAYYSSRGQATYAKAPTFVKDIPERYFDLARNWSLVRNLMLDTEVEVEHIFVSHRVKRWLLRYAQEIEEPEEIWKAANKLLHPPRGVRGHNDHMHVRIACSEDDKATGRCRTASAPKPKRARKWHRYMVCPRPVVASPVLPRI